MSVKNLGNFKLTVWTVNDVLSRSIPFYWVYPYPFIELIHTLRFESIHTSLLRVWIDSIKGYELTQDVIDGPHCIYCNLAARAHVIFCSIIVWVSCYLKRNQATPLYSLLRLFRNCNFDSSSVAFTPNLAAKVMAMMISTILLLFTFLHDPSEGKI